MKNINLVFGYLYHDIVSNQDRIEFHIDYWNQATTTALPTATLLTQLHQQQAFAFPCRRGL
jgi:HD-like signal output (HDOD) protein